MSRTLALITTLDGSGNYPDNSLPGVPGAPDQGLPPFPAQGLPEPPPGVWPPPVASHPIVPAPPGVPPGAMWPPVDPGYGQGRPPHPGNALPGSGARPDNTLPGGKPARPDNTVPGALPTKFWIVAGIPGYGWRYVCVDTTLVPGNELPAAPPARPDNTLPTTPQPKA